MNNDENLVVTVFQPVTACRRQYGSWRRLADKQMPHVNWESWTCIYAKIVIYDETKTFRRSAKSDLPTGCTIHKVTLRVRSQINC